MKTIAIALLFGGALLAQTQERNENSARANAGLEPIYRVSVTERTAKAINYQHRSGATKIDFRGTELMPKARGEAKVESKQGYIEVEVEFDDLQPANRQGAEYLTYVLWAITPEGRTSNLGEILLNGTKSKLDVTTELQVFGLVVTAEPYYSVTRPSDLIVMENVVRADTRGKIEEIDAKYELLQRGQYQRMTNPLALKLDSKIPLELYEARNAVQIARAVGSERFAAETFEKAEKSLAQAESYQARIAGSKLVTMTSREAVQTAEDARAIAVKRQEENALEAERVSSLNREIDAQSARVAAQNETARVTKDAATARVDAQAESDRLKRVNEAQALSAQNAANLLRQDNAAKTAASLTEAARLKAENEAKLTAAQTEVERVKRDSDAKLAATQAETDRVKRDADVKVAATQAETDRVKRDADAKLAASQAEVARIAQDNLVQKAATQAAMDRAASDKQKLETEKADLRSQLLVQLNTILQTRDTARGLIVNMSDVLFNTGQSSLQPGAREKLAKVAGIAAGHPGLSFEIEGHTDSVGTDASNQLLSERRGESVRDYLVGQGMVGSSISTKGLGRSQPVASNDTAAGRQQNRRVELVISGAVIGEISPSK
jgi:outer membrane protein OmpA-like peptidoglycan-associated protein